MTPLTPLYTSSFLLEAPNLPGHGTPVVRYSDHCATIQALQDTIDMMTGQLQASREQADRANSLFRAVAEAHQQLNLATDQKELAFMHTARAILGDLLNIPDYHQNKPMDEFIGRVASGPVVGRWDDKDGKLPSAL